MTNHKEREMSKRLIKSKHELTEGDWYRLEAALKPLIEEFGTEAIDAVVKHFIETVAEWND
jgi:hypothetical protein